MTSSAGVARRLAPATASLLAVYLAGCSEIGILLGLRTRLDKQPVTAISASLVDKTGLAPVTARQLL